MFVTLFYANNSLIFRFKARTKFTNIYICLVNITKTQYNFRKEYKIFYLELNFSVNFTMDSRIELDIK